jgi:hypothetical protein
MSIYRFVFIALLSASSFTLAGTCSECSCTWPGPVCSCKDTFCSDSGPGGSSGGVKKVIYDVKEKDLNKVFSGFQIGVNNDVNAWVIASNRWANDNLKRAGYPSFEIGNDRVRGVITTTRSKWRDFSEKDLNAVEPNFKIGEINDPVVWARAANRAAHKKGYACGFPTFEIGTNRVRGVHMMHKNFAKFSDVTEKNLNAVDPEFKIGVDNSFEIWTRAINRFAVSKKKCRAGIPTYEIGVNRVRGMCCL